jgi:hypothetical protein
MAPVGGNASNARMSSSPDPRAPSATVCQDRSGAGGASGRTATNVPRPDRASISPSATSLRIASATVTGEA